MSDSKELTNVAQMPTQLAPYQLEVRAVAEKTAAVQECMRALMKDGTHYGTIPGCLKPSLWQPGTDILGVLFRLRPEYDTIRVVEDHDFICFTVRCRLLHIDSGKEWSSGVGSANSREAKYAPPTKAPGRACPKCQGEYIIKGRDEYGGGWICFAKKGGCGAKFRDGDKSVEGQSPKKPEPLTPSELTAHIYNLHNTILKIAAKRAKVAATLTATAASDIFTQDLEDLIEFLPAPPAPVTVPEKREPSPLPAERPKRETKAETAEKWREEADGPDVFVERVDDKTGEVVSVAKVRKSQLAKIHILKNRIVLDATKAKMTDEDWQGRLRKLFGVTSSGALTVEEASDLIDRLNKLESMEDAKIKRKTERMVKTSEDTATALGEFVAREPGSDDDLKEKLQLSIDQAKERKK